MTQSKGSGQKQKGRTHKYNKSLKSLLDKIRMLYRKKRINDEWRIRNKIRNKDKPSKTANVKALTQIGVEAVDSLDVIVVVVVEGKAKGKSGFPKSVFPLHADF